ncbi:MAG TPA: LacI family DNA-binding transcriptional regulator [Rectinemataceae bacterium]|nr:LacI family DNA-binding transcriptional regulator [Rectinemataceae bacterium]
MASQSDVAKLANVSFMTVSRVVNGDPRVKPETRERVQRAIEELNYYPNAIARALNRQRTMTIGLILQKLEYVLSEPYISHLIYHIEKALIPHDYDMLVVSGEHRNGRDLTLLFKQKKVDGVIILGSQIDDPRIAALSADRSPSVLLHAHSDLPFVSCVDVDNYSIIEYFIDYLAALGHRRIAFIGGDSSVLDAYQRLDAYEACMAKRCLPLEKDLVFRGNWSSGSGYEAFLHFDKLRPRPSAVIASNDHMAIGFLKAAYEHQVRIPEDLSLVGIDDIEMAAFTTPKLTTMRQPMQTIASAAVETLIGAMEDRDKPASHIILEAEPIIRDSCGPNPTV